MAETTVTMSAPMRPIMESAGRDDVDDQFTDEGSPPSGGDAGARAPLNAAQVELAGPADAAPEGATDSYAFMVQSKDAQTPVGCLMLCVLDVAMSMILHQFQILREHGKLVVHRLPELIGGVVDGVSAAQKKTEFWKMAILLKVPAHIDLINKYVIRIVEGGTFVDVKPVRLDPNRNPLHEVAAALGVPQPPANEPPQPQVPLQVELPHEVHVQPEVDHGGVIHGGVIHDVGSGGSADTKRTRHV